MHSLHVGRVLPGVCLLFVLLASRLASQETAFVRGDVNQDGYIEISDALATLNVVVRAGFVIDCEKAADVNDSGAVDISDVIYGLAYLFERGPAPPAPFGTCGTDPTPDGLDCASHACSDIGGSLIISEMMASNDESLMDVDDEASDWLELHMPDSAPAASIDLGGWYLTDNVFLQSLWQFPAGVTMERGDFLVVFASGKDRAIAGEELHTDFRLDADGGYLALVAPDGVTIVDEFAPFYPEQLRDISYGLAQSTTPLVRTGDTVRYRVPTSSDAGLGTSWTDPGFATTGWQTGESGLGFSSITGEGFEVTVIRANVIVDHISAAESVLANPSQQISSLTRTASVIDYFNSGGGGNYANDNAFPGLGFTDFDDFVVHVTGTVMIPQAGAWSFGVNSDDGFSFEMTDGVRSYNMAYPTPRGPSDTIQVFNVASAGPHDIELLFYERGGGAGLELFAAQGSHPSYNQSAFRLVGDTANGGLGLLGFAGDIRTDLASAMRNVNASVWTRFTFQVSNAAQLGGLALRMKYEDGFVAYINGQEVARRNAPVSLPWNATAVTNRPIEDAPLVEEINLTSYLGSLRDGTNVLAIHGLNDGAANGDFLLDAELVAAGRGSDLQYMSTPTPGTFNVSGSVDFVRKVTVSEEHGFFAAPFQVTLATPTSGAQIRYTTDGSTPTATSGTVYSGPLTINQTTVLRAAGFRANHLASAVTTCTYLFLADVIRQSPSGQRPGPAWPSGSVNGQIIDYGMDPNVVDNARWSGRIVDALLQIPSISLVTDLGHLFSSSTGIYVNAGNDGRAWERPTSVELLDPDGSPGFSVDAGLRIRGAFSRSDSNPKHSFRLFFRKEYGPGKLDFPLFGGEGVDEFDKVDLRTSQNYSWAFEGSSQNTFLRDVFSRDAQKDMRKPYTRSRFYHLYLNGQYWGLYQTEERADADYAASYLGGSAGDYDVIKNDSSSSRALHATDGTITAYRALYDAAVAGFSSNTAYRRVQGLLSDGSPDPNRAPLVDVPNLIDYMACTYYTGDPDAPVSAWAHFSNNVFAIYNHTNPKGFTWYRHDAEHSLGANGGLNEARLLTDPTDRSIGQQWQHFNPAWLHLRLTQNAEYLLAFADRVNQLFFHGGAFTPASNSARWRARRDQIDLAVIAASARWGDSKREPPRTKDDWDSEVNSMLSNYFPQRTQIVLNQMRSVDMFPDQAIVTFSQHGGEVTSGFSFTMSQGNGTSGTIYYTLDGSDPREWGGALSSSAAVYSTGSPVSINATTTVRARVRSGNNWGAMTQARFTVGLEGLVINEIMASNKTGLEDPDEPGENPDWLEIYNGTNGAVNLGGMYLTDDPTRLTKWQFAAGTVIPPAGYLVIYADDDGTQGPRHTSYQLSQSGETLTLVDSDGVTVIDEVVFDQQQEDVSYGRFPDGSASWGFLQNASPGGFNGPFAP